MQDRKNKDILDNINRGQKDKNIMDNGNEGQKEQNHHG